MKFSMTDRKQKEKLAIVSIKVIHDMDNSPDLSWLGEYSNSPDAVHIDREERGDRGHGEYRYFNMSSNYKDESPEDQQKYMEQDYKRMEDFNRGGWYMIGITAKAVISRNVGGACQLHTFESGGLWGIESDSEPSFFDEVADEQLAELKTILKDFGVPLRNFKKLANEAKDNVNQS